MATQPAYPLLNAKEFLAIDFGGGRKAELDAGVIRMLGGVSAGHAIVQGNILAFLHGKLRGSGCMPYSSIFAIRTSDYSVRRADVTVYCGREGAQYDNDLAGDDALAVFEVLSAGTARTDLRTKLDEYKAMPSIDTIVYVDIAVERVRVVQRTGPNGWSDDRHSEPHDVALPSLDLTIPHTEIFAND